MRTMLLMLAVLAACGGDGHKILAEIAPHEAEMVPCDVLNWNANDRALHAFGRALVDGDQCQQICQEPHDNWISVGNRPCPVAFDPLYGEVELAVPLAISIDSQLYGDCVSSKPGDPPGPVDFALCQ